LPGRELGGAGDGGGERFQVVKGAVMFDVDAEFTGGGGDEDSSAGMGEVEAQGGWRMEGRFGSSFGCDLDVCGGKVKLAAEDEAESDVGREVEAAVFFRVECGGATALFG
jgi:hypothetical protein